MLIPRLRRALLPAVVASILLVAGCSAPGDAESAPTSSTSPTVEASPTPSYAPMVVPEATDDELARTVFVDVGADGVPSTESEIQAAPERGVPYALEGVCIPTGDTLVVDYVIMSTDDPQIVVQSGSVPCDGTSIRDETLIDTDTPPQLSFVGMDGVSEAYLRLVPADSE
jgi:hypothetical protein